MAEWWQRQRTSLSWWSLAVGLAAALKWYFSVAAASELGWMLRPLATLLRVVSGWHFQRNGSGEWISVDAGIVLIKACAGINFMILSFLGWCWMSRPQGRANATASATAWLEWPLLLAAALVYAWLTALAVNALRVLAVVHWQPTLEQWLQPTQAHRLIGLGIYLPGLSLQLALVDRHHWERALLAGCALYAALMLLVPLLTGNAALDTGAYRMHALSLLALLLPLVLLAVIGYRRRLRSPSRSP